MNDHQFTFYCGCGYVTHDPDAVEHESDICCNCGGRECMDCVLRYMHDECEHSCPDCEPREIKRYD